MYIYIYIYISWLSNSRRFGSSKCNLRKTGGTPMVKRDSMILVASNLTGQSFQYYKFDFSRVNFK